MSSETVYGSLGQVCVIGFGSIGKGVLPLIRRHFNYESITIIDPVQGPKPGDKATFIQVALTKDNFHNVLDQVFTTGNGFCVNLSVGTSSLEIMRYCQAKGVLYIDTVKEEWEGYYSNEELSVEKRTNYALRETLLRELKGNGNAPTAISCCGANPGMVSWFVKQALLNLAKDLNHNLEEMPTCREEWATLMQQLGVKGIHIAERDTQRSASQRPAKEFWNTWSVDGFISEGFYQAAQLGWGTHEKELPQNGKTHKNGCQAAIYLEQPGMATMVKSWCPTLGPQFGFLVTHDEAISISDYYTIRQNAEVTYRPTCHYAYHPCEDAVSSAMESMGAGECPQKWKILQADIIDGSDELGVLLYGHARNAYWYGSQLDIHRARAMAPDQNATGLQVSSAVLAGMVWALENPKAGVVEPDEMDFERCLQVQRQYIEPINGYYTEWNPLSNQRNMLSQQAFDLTDPWQFKNVLIHK